MIQESRTTAQKKVKELIKNKFYTKTKLAEKLDMSLSSLYNRLRECNWSGDEVNIIMGL